MRSRYTAYATGSVGHVMATTDPRSPHRDEDAIAWRQSLAAWCEAVSFQELTVLDAAVDGDRGEVTFFARLASLEDGRDLSFGERSTFVRRDGRWLYVDGVRTPAG